MQPHSKQPPPQSDPVSEIGALLSDELTAVERTLRQVLDSESELIRSVGEYICLTSGKKLRPSITLLAARALGAPAPPPIQVAAAMELVHVATLLHDDVIDKAEMRRGKSSVNARWGDEVAILMADYLYASAFKLSLETLDKEPLRLICQVTRKMCEGEMFQIERRDRWLSCDDYLHIITRKTAFLFSACGAIGGMAAGLQEESVVALSAFGLDFGLAFQITDDALDFTARNELWGKVVGIDVLNGKQTLPLILALREATPEDVRTVEAVLDAGRDSGPVLEIIDRYHGIEQALDIARDYARSAISHLEGLPVHDQVAFDHLLSLPEYVISRQY